MSLHSGLALPDPLPCVNLFDELDGFVRPAHTRVRAFVKRVRQKVLFKFPCPDRGLFCFPLGMVLHAVALLQLAFAFVGKQEITRLQIVLCPLGVLASRHVVPHKLVVPHVVEVSAVQVVDSPLSQSVVDALDLQVRVEAARHADVVVRVFESLLAQPVVRGCPETVHVVFCAGSLQ